MLFLGINLVNLKQTQNWKTLTSYFYYYDLDNDYSLIGSLFWVSILGDIGAAFDGNDIPTTFDKSEGKGELLLISFKDFA